MDLETVKQLVELYGNLYDAKREEAEWLKSVERYEKEIDCAKKQLARLRCESEKLEAEIAALTTLTIPTPIG